MIMRRGPKVIALATVAVLMLASCADSGSSPAPAVTTRQGSPTTAGTPSGSGASTLGRWTSTEFDGAFVSIADDGTFTGDDGCNGLGGSWKMADDGTSLELSEVFQTLMGCEEGTSWAAGPTTFSEQSGKLVVTGEGGTVLDTLTR